MAVTHLAFDFGAGDQRSDRVHHQHVDRVGADQRIGNLERLFARVGLRNDQFLDVDAQLLGIDRVERVFGVDESGRAARLLRFGDDMQRQRGLARAFRTIDLDHPALGQPPHAQRDIEPERAGGNRFHLHGFLLAQLHRRTLAECAVDLCERGVQCLLAVCVHFLVLYELQTCRHDTTSCAWPEPATDSSTGAVCIGFVPKEQVGNEINPASPIRAVR